MAKTNTGLVSFCKDALNAGTGYVYGTFGRTCTIALLDDCAKRYPDPDLAGGSMRKLGEKWIGKRVVDCIGLVKYYMFSNRYGENPQYVSNYDQSANTTFNRATSKGTINTIPEIPGLLLHMNGHVGVYIGNGDVIEARGTAYGVVKTKLSSRPWTHWYKSQWIAYPSTDDSFTCDTNSTVTIKKGNKYQARITCSQRPNVVSGSAGIVSISLASQSGKDYFFAFTGIKAGSTGIYINGSSSAVFVCKVV